MQSYSKKKDANPIDTVNKIKGILQNLDITTTEKIFKASNNCFSCTVDCNEYKLHSNGKGTTLNYNFASGYAELIERLQSFDLGYPPPRVI